MRRRPRRPILPLAHHADTPKQTRRRPQPIEPCHVARGIDAIRLHRFKLLMHQLNERCLGEQACGRPGSTRDASAPLTEPADADSAYGNDPISRASRTGSTGPRCHEGRTPRPPRRLVAGYGRVPWRGRGSISLTSQCTGRSHRLKDCAAPPIFSRRPKEGAVRKSVPPLAASGGRFAILDPMLDLPVAGPLSSR